VKQLVLDILPPAAPTFANFVVGRNEEAVMALSNLHANPRVAGPIKVVYLWGERSCGKSHLLAAFASDTNATPLSALLASVDSNAVVKSVVADDVEALADSDQVALFDAINRRAVVAGSVVVAAGNVAPRDLPLRPELSSRLGSGLVFQVHPLSDAEKGAALRAHAKARGFALREDVAGYLLRHARRDMRSLISILDALDQYSLETGREVTLPLLKQMSQPSLV
jgi:DnaA-homolog protein